VEVGDHEIRVVCGEITGGDANKIPLTPPSRKSREAIENSMGVSNLTEPRHIVPIQLKTDPVGTAIK